MASSGSGRLVATSVFAPLPDDNLRPEGFVSWTRTSWGVLRVLPSVSKKRMGRLWHLPRAVDRILPTRFRAMKYEVLFFKLLNGGPPAPDMVADPHLPDLVRAQEIARPDDPDVEAGALQPFDEIEPVSPLRAARPA